MNIHRTNSMDVDDDDNHLNNNVDLMEDVNLVQVAIDSFTEAVFDYIV
jgi:hypothetical protein